MCVLPDKKQQTDADTGTKEGVVVVEEEEACDTLVRAGGSKAVLQVCTICIPIYIYIYIYIPLKPVCRQLLYIYTI